MYLELPVVQRTLQSGLTYQTAASSLITSLRNPEVDDCEIQDRKGVTTSGVWHGTLLWKLVQSMFILTCCRVIQMSCKSFAIINLPPQFGIFCHIPGKCSLFPLSFCYCPPPSQGIYFLALNICSSASYRLSLSEMMTVFFSVFSELDSSCDALLNSFFILLQLQECLELCSFVVIFVLFHCFTIFTSFTMFFIFHKGICKIIITPVLTIALFTKAKIC